jgi:hypothetical protein
MNKAYSRVNWSNDTSKKTFINDTNLNVMDKGIDVLDDRIIDLDGRILELEGYEEEAKESAENADVSEANAKTSENNAKASETKAKEYMEKAFAGTPDGYDALVSKVDSLDIKKTTDSTLYGSKHGGARLVGMVGNTVQNGTPSQSTPQPMYHTSDCVEMIQGWYALTNGAYTNHANYVCNKNKIPCKVGDVVKFNVENIPSAIVLSYYDENGNFLAYSDKYPTTNTLEVTVETSGVSFFNFSLKDDNGVTVDTVGKITLQINGKYVNCIECTQNLVKGLEFGALDSGNGAEITTASVHRTPYIEVNPSDKLFVFGYDISATRYVRVFYFDKDKKWISDVVFTNHFEITIPTNCHYIRMQIDQSVTGYRDIVVSYVPQEEYHEPIRAHFLTNEPLRKGDILFKDTDGLHKIERKVAERILTSKNAGWMQANNIVGHKGVFFTQTYKTDHVYPQYPLCETFSQASGYSDVSNYVCAIDKTGSFWVCNDDITTIQDFATWVDENPIKVQYTLATPTIEVLDTESQLALNSLKTFDNVTYLEFDSRVKPSEIEVEYGTSQVGAYTLQSLNNTEANAIRLNELAVAMVSLGSEV